MTKTVTRYTQPCVQTQPGLEFKVAEVELFPDANGKWVRYEDYAELSKLWEDACRRMSGADEPSRDVVLSEQRRSNPCQCANMIIHTPLGIPCPDCGRAL